MILVVFLSTVCHTAVNERSFALLGIVHLFLCISKCPLEFNEGKLGDSKMSEVERKGRLSVLWLHFGIWTDKMDVCLAKLAAWL